MQRFSQRESVLLGYSPQKTFTDPSSSPETPSRNSDIDFNDVFGGPPRQPSIQETRHGFGENRRIDEQVVAASSRDPWSGLSEKPVFGEEEMARRRRSKSDFFNDIFRGNESSSASSKYEMKDPLPPKPGGPGPFGSSSPAHFRHPSLPAKLNKGMDLPTFGSSTQTTSKSKDGSSNGLSYYGSSPMSKFSDQANQDKEEPRNGFQSSYCFSEGNEESTNLTEYVETERKGNSNEDSSISENSKNGSRFHFSIYKWADKGGVPVANRLRGSDRRKEKDKLQRSSSANGWRSHESIAKEPKDKLHNIFYSFNGRSSKCRSFRENKNDGELCRIIEEDNITKSESETINKVKSTVKNVSKEVSAAGNATHKPQSKPLNLHLDDDNDDERGNGEITKNSGSQDITEMNVKKLSEILDGKNTKKQDVKKRATSNVETNATSVKHSPRNSWDIGKARVRGKVKELIKFFNQDSSSRPRTDAAPSENHGSSRKERDKVKPEIEPNISMNKRVETSQQNSVIKNSYSDIPVANDMCNGASEKKLNSSVKDTVSDDSKTIVEDPAVLFEDNFLIEDLTPEENNLPQFGVDPEEIKAIDDKIQQWLNGKQRNIRSLLSTLQYVLWPGCGWKPVPLVDIIEGPAVKRSYQKALLCLHPDKLQQRGAASDQKYIAQQVFDILQDAWTHFNSLALV